MPSELSIGELSARSGVSQSALRFYEREGLIKPVRTAGNTRLYGQDEIRKLEMILALTRDLGVNLAGVEVILKMQSALHEAREAIDRAASVVAERTELDDEERERVARAVGIGALKYADLSSDREKDYVFSWERMLAMDGNTAVYLQYANARIRSILRKAEAAGKVAKVNAVVLSAPAERALTLKLAQFPAAVQMATDHLQPHRLCTYLYETATAFSTFYETCSVLNAETPELRASRLLLCELASRTITAGLNLLGIEAPERL